MNHPRIGNCSDEQRWRQNGRLGTERGTAVMIAGRWREFRCGLAGGPGRAWSAELRGRIEAVAEGGTQYAAEHDRISDEQAERGSG